MATKKIGAVDFSKTIETMLLEYGEKVNEVLDKSVETVAEAAADKLRGHRRFSPKGHATGRYAESWKADKQTKGRIYTRWVIVNVDYYRLTHLLEKGHPIKNRSGRTVGNSPAYPHIKEVDDWVQKALPEEIKWRLGNDA